MKIIIIQENGRHDANRSFRESCCLKRSFESLGHECVIWGLGHSNFQSFPDFNSYDLVINLENYGDNWIPNLSNFRKPFKMIWCIDAHVRGTAPYENMFSRGGYNLLAHSTKDYVKSSHHHWLPNCTDSTLLRKINDVPKKYAMGFCGNHVTPVRKQSVELLSQIFGLKQDIFVIGEEMVKAINSYHVHFNMNISTDINYRSFETLACGSVLFTSRNYQYDELGFVDGKNCFFYSDQEDMIRKATELVARVKANDSTLIDVANNGTKLFLNRHTYDHRANEILNLAMKGMNR